MTTQDDSTASHVLALAERADDRTRVLKHEDTFVVFDHYGEIQTGGLGEQGLYHDGTRHLSRLAMNFNRRRPFLLSSTIRDENDQLLVTLTNPDFVTENELVLPLGSLHFRVRSMLWNGACYRHVTIRNFGPRALHMPLSWQFAADFADIFEVRGMRRTKRGALLTPELTDHSVTLKYQGLDEKIRTSTISFDPPPSVLKTDHAVYDLSLNEGEEFALTITVSCGESHDHDGTRNFRNIQQIAESTLQRNLSSSCRVRSSDGHFDSWIKRAESDLSMMISDLPTGPYPYAGVPWFNTPFGRDGIITALETLWLRPNLSAGVLRYLASSQATSTVREEDAEPGKILHETRRGEMAILKEMPFGRYYGSVDATPLFVFLAGAYWERTGDLELVREIWPQIKAALHWIDHEGDPDQDGFIEYQRNAVGGLLHQGWKDSDDSIFHADGKPVVGPIALCEVQGYGYAAKQTAAILARELGDEQLSDHLTRQAHALQQQFEEAFWCESINTYAMALDGNKQPCTIRTSNPGHCLFTGICRPDRARIVGQGLMTHELFSGWGIRTLASTERNFNPMAYHNGSVWPHDNALIAMGFSRYGMHDFASRLLSAQFEAGIAFELGRMPELFCGFTREPGEGPTPYPVACSPQAWAAASVFMLLQASLGIWINGINREIRFVNSHLPGKLRELTITNLTVGDATLDLSLTRNAYDISVNVVHREGSCGVVMMK